MSHEATIKDLILAAAEGASAGVSELQKMDIPIELEEFEVEVTYAAQTTVETKDKGLQLKFLVFKAKIGQTKATRSNATYGLKVRFLFSGKETEA